VRGNFNVLRQETMAFGQAGLPIYTDHLVNGFQDGSWGVSAAQRKIIRNNRRIVIRSGDVIFECDGSQIHAFTSNEYYVDYGALARLTFPSGSLG